MTLRVWGWLRQHPVRVALCALIGALVLLSVLLVWRHDKLMRQLLHPERRHVSAQALIEARRRLPGLESVAFRSADGLTLRGWYVPSRNRAAVVLVHGAAENRLWWLDEAESLVGRGFGVLLYDNRAAGESDGDLQSWGDREQDDVIGALDFLQQRPDVDPERLGAEGFSIGASTVALAAARDRRVRAVVLKAVWTGLPEELLHMLGGGWQARWVLRDFARAGVRLEAVNPLARISVLAPRPVMVVVGNSDHHVPMEVAQTVFEAAGTPRTWRVIPGADHVDYERLGGGPLRAEVAAFFAKGLLTSPDLLIATP